MDSNFKVILTGRRKKDLDISKAAELISNNSKFVPAQIIKFLKSKEEKVIIKSTEHKNAYSIKRIIEQVGIEIRLEPAKLYSQQTAVKEPKAAKEKPKKFFKNIKLFKKSKEKNEQKSKPIEIDWEEKPRYKTYTSIQTKSTSISFTNILLIGLFAGGFWYLFNSGFSFGSADAFDEDGNPIVILFTSNQCGTICNDVVRDLKFRQVPFKHLNINPDSTDDEDVKLWKSVGKNAFPLTVSGKEILAGNSKPLMATLLGLNFGSKYLTNTERPLYRNHFNRDGTDAIAIYGAEWCGPCKSLRKQLKNAGIPFHYTDIDRVGNKSAVKEALDIRGYPSVWIGYTRTKGISFSSIKSTYNNL